MSTGTAPDHGCRPCRSSTPRGPTQRVTSEVTRSCAERPAPTDRRRSPPAVAPTGTNRGTRRVQPLPPRRRPVGAARSSSKRDHLPTRSVLTRCAAQDTLRSRWLPGRCYLDRPEDHPRQRLRLQLDCLFALPSSRFARMCRGSSPVERSDPCSKAWSLVARQQQTASKERRATRSAPGSLGRARRPR